MFARRAAENVLVVILALRSKRVALFTHQTLGGRRRAHRWYNNLELARLQQATMSDAELRSSKVIETFLGAGERALRVAQIALLANVSAADAAPELERAYMSVVDALPFAATEQREIAGDRGRAAVSAYVALLRACGNKDSDDVTRAARLIEPSMRQWLEAASVHERRSTYRWRLYDAQLSLQLASETPSLDEIEASASEDASVSTRMAHGRTQLRAALLRNDASVVYQKTESEILLFAIARQRQASDAGEQMQISRTAFGRKGVPPSMTSAAALMANTSPTCARLPRANLRAFSEAHGMPRSTDAARASTCTATSMPPQVCPSRAAQRFFAADAGDGALLALRASGISRMKFCGHSVGDELPGLVAADTQFKALDQCVRRVARMASQFAMRAGGAFEAKELPLIAQRELAARYTSLDDDKVLAERNVLLEQSYADALRARWATGGNNAQRAIAVVNALQFYTLRTERYGAAIAMRYLDTSGPIVFKAGAVIGIVSGVARLVHLASMQGALPVRIEALDGYSDTAWVALTTRMCRLANDLAHTLSLAVYERILTALALEMPFAYPDDEDRQARAFLDIGAAAAHLLRARDRAEDCATRIADSRELMQDTIDAILDAPGVAKRKAMFGEILACARRSLDVVARVASESAALLAISGVLGSSPRERYDGAPRQVDASLFADSLDTSLAITTSIALRLALPALEAQQSLLSERFLQQQRASAIGT